MKKELDRFIEREENKIKKSKELLERLKSVPFGIFNPRFWRIKKELDKSIKSFNISDFNSQKTK